jgi:hypothetical protein
MCICIEKYTKKYSNFRHSSLITRMSVYFKRCISRLKRKDCWADRRTSVKCWVTRKISSDHSFSRGWNFKWALSAAIQKRCFRCIKSCKTNSFEVFIWNCEPSLGCDPFLAFDYNANESIWFQMRSSRTSNIHTQWISI